MLRKILEPSMKVFILLLIGSLIGFALSTIIYKTTIQTANESYDLGYKNAQKDCVELIKNTK